MSKTKLVIGLGVLALAVYSRQKAKAQAGRNLSSVQVGRM